MNKYLPFIWISMENLVVNFHTRGLLTDFYIFEGLGWELWSGLFTTLQGISKMDIKMDLKMDHVLRNRSKILFKKKNPINIQ
jgi:hypothetical protein